MALEELLRRQDQPAAARPSAAGTETRERESLIRQTASMLGMTEESIAPPEEAGGEEERPCCADGYARRSPVQPYRVAEDYHKRRVRKAVTVAVGICAAVLLVIALVRAGLVRF